MPSLQDWLQDVANVWPMVWANKATLIPILVGIVVFEWVILSFWYSGRLASKEAEIRLQVRVQYPRAGLTDTDKLLLDQRNLLARWEP